MNLPQGRAVLRTFIAFPELEKLQIQVSIRIPRNSDLFLRVPAGDVEVRGIGGHKDVEFHAGDLTVEVGSPENYAHTDASVKAGELNAAPFGVSKAASSAPSEKKARANCASTCTSTLAASP